MLAKEVLRNSMDLNRRIKEQSVIYQDWKAMAMEIDEDEIHEIVEAAWDDLIASIRLKRKLEELIMANHNADQREILRLRYLYAATWDAIADELNDSVAWVKEQYQKALKNSLQKPQRVAKAVTAVPKKCKKPCKHPGCPNLTDGLYCAEHQPLHPDRPSAAKRGYGSRWQRLSKAYLRRHPLCVRCKAQGRFTAATVVDHIIPHRGDPHLMWDESNWQALCKSCHDHKTWTEDRNPVYRY